MLAPHGVRRRAGRRAARLPRAPAPRRPSLAPSLRVQRSPRHERREPLVGGRALRRLRRRPGGDRRHRRHGRARGATSPSIRPTAATTRRRPVVDATPTTDLEVVQIAERARSVDRAGARDDRRGTGQRLRRDVPERRPRPDELARRRRRAGRSRSCWPTARRSRGRLRRRRPRHRHRGRQGRRRALSARPTSARPRRSSSGSRRSRSARRSDLAGGPSVTVGVVSALHRQVDVRRRARRCST